MGILPCPQMCTHTLSLSLGWCTGLATPVLQPQARWGVDLLQFSMTVLFVTMPLGMCPAPNQATPLAADTSVWARPAWVSPWHDRIVVWKGHSNWAHRLGDPGTSLSTLEHLLLNVFVSGRYPALKQLFLKNWSSCIINCFCRSFAKFLLCYPRSSTLLQAS